MANNFWLDVNGDWNNVLNWSLGAAPVTGDSVYINSGSQNINTNVSGHSGVTLASLNIGAGFTGQLGTTATPLAIGATLANFGVLGGSGPAQQGSGRIVWDAGSVQTLINVYSTGVTPLDAGLPALRIKGTHASNKIITSGGITGVGVNAVGEAATMLEADVVNGSQLLFGTNVSWTTANVSDRSTFTTLSGGGTTLSVSNSSKAVVSGSVLVGTVNCNGNIIYNIRPASGNLITTCNLFADGTMDYSQNPSTGVIGTLNLYVGGTWRNNAAVPNHITATSLVRMDGGTLELS